MGDTWCWVIQWSERMKANLCLNECQILPCSPKAPFLSALTRRQSARDERNSNVELKLEREERGEDR